ncbi:RNA polymerase sigma-70 factor (TIGR02957 family) [Microbacteriaceae bacterium SG_E_30_P1]|uniref:RNA polymerase sigma-70 factor (TIGR02957 family) n=1 Tax=Antiquaquibacter oligotrophicus TaxID=2880260 RepID=A0ABT6KSE7_9MICO|nr:RNA polymerase sigma-70 factor [Antiquaquibacter oligotrophicus]MDH6182423.1 RNA polymerase sigma-70 factor (TIGR02957 family) [Antiquaquibacter oligotrophicus]UDF14606.1 RNA polymerase sigma-70 factor [Antiquaquibacter oligotrophicus]
MTNSLAHDQFMAVRPRLFGIAYRMLGSATEADDILQDVWLTWQRIDPGTVGNPQAYLATATTRASINAATTARVRRETYIGPWLPEPVDTSADPALGAERAEALEIAVLLLLERLSPVERAAYVLREAFAYPYETIAEIVQLNQPAVRQLVSRARKHLAAERRAPVESGQRRRLLEAFLLAAQRGDLQQLEQLFAEDVVSASDGGGRAKLAARIPIVGRTKVAKFITAFSSHFWNGVSMRWATVNGEESVVLSWGGVESAVLTATASGDGITRLMWLMNPDKLGAVVTA